MKKIYFLSLLCLLSAAAFAQTTVTIYATGGSGTYTTGNASSTGVRTDNTIVATGTAPAKRGYAVFDLSTIPQGSGIVSVTAGFYVAAPYGAGTVLTNTYGFAGDLSTVTAPATLYADMVVGSLLSPVAYAAGTGNHTIASTPTAVAFLQANEGQKVSYCYTNTGTSTFNISGETGAASTSLANHAPYLTITYCPAPTVVTATASPATLCEGDMLTLTGTGAGTGTVTWGWTGPAGFSSALISTTLTTGPGSSGVYSLTVTNTCASGVGTATVTTVPVTVNPLPVITGGPVCTGSTITLSGAPAGGSWVSSMPSIASVNPSTGDLTGNSPGTTTITYTDPNGCVNTSDIDDNDAPTPISGSSTVCVGSAISLTDGVSGGTWSVDFPGIATVGGTGIVSGFSPGLATVTYDIAGCPSVSQPVTVVDIPSAITGPTDVCIGSTATLSDPDLGLVWSSSNITLATVGSTGDVVGVAAGSVTISYTDPSTTCSAIYLMTVDALPAAIAGVSTVCNGSSITLTDATPGGLFSSAGAFTSVAGGGTVTGFAAGVEDVTYTVTGTGCSITTPITVNPLPAIVNVGAGVLCQGATLIATDVDPGGNWLSANIGIATVGTSSGVVTGTGAGMTSIIYTLPTGCASSAVVTVNAAPVSLISPAGPTTFCAGGSVVLNGTAGAGLQYQWNLGGAPLPGATLGSYTANLTGMYTLSITNGLGCVTTSVAVHVVAGIVGVVNNVGPMEFCIGNHVTLKANTGSVTGSINYQWRRNGVSILGATDSTYAAGMTGDYSVDINISGGSGTCAIVSDTVSVAVNPLPTPAISYNDVVLSTATGYTHYQWFLNNVSIPGANSNVLVPTANGSFKVEVADGNSCNGFSPPFPVTNVGVKQVVLASDIRISPNPATTVLHIESPVSVRAVISGIEGRVISQYSDAKEISLSGLASGIYLVSVFDQDGNRLVVQKFIKE